MYDIQFRAEHNLLDIRWTGSFTPEAVADYARELRSRFVQSGFRSGYRLRMDMRESAAQTQQALTAFARHLGSFPKAERIAVVTGSAITRAQVTRVMTQPYLRVFECSSRAAEWLLADTRSR